jgi:hypothetical protein
MQDFVSKLLSNKVVEARSLLNDRIKDLVNEKLDQIKIQIATELYKNVGVILEVSSTTRRSNVIRQGRTKLIKFRVRKGKIQRGKKFSAVKGYTIRGGHLVRMMPAEKRHRQIAARRAKFKKASKLKQSLRKRRMSTIKRRSVGL